MKTTVEIPDALFRQAKEHAARHGVPLRRLVELGLETVLRDAKHPRRRFRMKSITTKGEGLICEDDWTRIRSLIYEGHGG